MWPTVEIKLFLEHRGQDAVGVNNTAGIWGWKQNSPTKSQGKLADNLTRHSVATTATQCWMLWGAVISLVLLSDSKEYMAFRQRYHRSINWWNIWGRNLRWCRSHREAETFCCSLSETVQTQVGFLQKKNWENNVSLFIAPRLSNLSHPIPLSLLCFQNSNSLCTRKEENSRSEVSQYL